MYYDGCKIMSMKDLNGNKPLMRIISDLRSAGKTTFFNRLLVNRYKKTGKKFVLLYRYAGEMDGAGDKFFKEIKELFFPNCTYDYKMKNKGLYGELTFNGNVCGFALALNKSDQIRKCSHLFADVDTILFDEFQSESNKYLSNEIVKFQSIYTSIARGHGLQIRDVECILVSNYVTMLNPYFTSTGIYKSVQSNTTFLRLPGIVCEFGFNKELANERVSSGFTSIFTNSDYNTYLTEKVYMNDDNSSIINYKGPLCGYFCTVYDDGLYGVYRTNENFLYVNEKADISYPVGIRNSTSNTSVVNYGLYKDTLREIFQRGQIKFQNLKCKNAFISALSY